MLRNERMERLCLCTMRRSPALTISKVVMSLRSMLASATDKRRPDGDGVYCLTSRGKSPQDTRWQFDDDKV